MKPSILIMSKCSFFYKKKNIAKQRRGKNLQILIFLRFGEIKSTVSSKKRLKGLLVYKKHHLNFDLIKMFFLFDIFLFIKQKSIKRTHKLKVLGFLLLLTFDFVKCLNAKKQSKANTF